MVTLPGVASERGDVVAHPLERGNLIEQRHVSRSREPRVEMVEVGEAERAEPVVDGDDDHVAAARQFSGIEEGTRADVERATVDPHHDGMVCATDSRLRARTESGGEHVQREAVFADRDVDDPAERRRLHRLRRAGTPLGGVAHAAPWLRRLGREEATLPHRRSRERDATELGDAARHEPVELAQIERDPHAHVRARLGGRTT